MAKAYALHAGGTLSEAAAAYRSILAGDPSHREARHHLGVLLFQQGDTVQSLALIRQALADGGNASRYNDLGNILSQLGQFTEATAAFRAATELNGSDANTWNNLGSVLSRQQDAAGAEQAYRRAIACDATFTPALSNLATLLLAAGNEEEGSLLMCQAFVQPPLAGKSHEMLGIAYYRLGRIADAAGCYRAWLLEEPGNAIAQHRLAACSGEGVPDKAPGGFVTAVFDEMAATFNEKLVGKLAYRGPEIIADLLLGQIAGVKTLDILDGGCGTGLCAALLSPFARHLTGVDLSPGMLAQARTLELYDEVVEAELTGYLQRRQSSFDLVVMADTLIYFGELATVFTAARQSLKAGGKFAFTIETMDTADSISYRLNPSGRYAHSRAYLLQALQSAGFAVLRSSDVVLRSEFCQPEHGLAVLAA